MLDLSLSVSDNDVMAAKRIEDVENEHGIKRASICLLAYLIVSSDTDRGCSELFSLLCDLGDFTDDEEKSSKFAYVANGIKRVLDANWFFVFNRTPWESRMNKHRSFGGCWYSMKDFMSIPMNAKEVYWVSVYMLKFMFSYEGLYFNGIKKRIRPFFEQLKDMGDDGLGRVKSKIRLKKKNLYKRDNREVVMDRLRELRSSG